MMPLYHRMPEIKPFFLYDQEFLVLLETNRFDEGNLKSYFFHGPVEVLEARDCTDIPKVFDSIERYSKDHYIAGYLSYELGYCLEDRLRRLNGVANAPLLQMGVFKDAIIFDHMKNSFGGAHEGIFKSAPPEPAPYRVKDLRLDISRQDYVEKIERIRRYIEAGDIYQANFTLKYRFGFDGCYYSFYRDLKKKQEVPYNAFMKLGDSYVLSISPELFLRKEGSRVTTRPMKGTMPRGKTLNEDHSQADHLGADIKNRAENVMIVDLERNDLGRISKTGSVMVNELFTVEKYQTLYQMTSTVTAELAEGVGFMEIFRSIFPSGSVTGAPKIRSMEIIRELEQGPRGVYTGAIGFIAPGGDAVFNIPIRTITIDEDRGEMGVGSGIVYDSDPAGEYEECRLKAEFLLKEPRDFQLIETMLWDEKFNRLPLHMERLRESAEYFDFSFDEASIRQRLGEAEETLKNNERYRVRLLLSKDGTAEVSATALGEQPKEYLAAVSDVRTSSGDIFLYHKTTMRDIYESEYKKCREQGCFDVLFINEREVECGLLNGIFRQDFLSQHPECKEKVLTLDDLYSADEVYLTNSVREMVRVRLEGRG
jgi:para-aminobenzoate synthetase/4-amino-4-deoxychorismate lyase